MGTHKERRRHSLLTLDVCLILSQEAVSIARKREKGKVIGSSGKQEGKSHLFTHVS